MKLAELSVRRGVTFAMVFVVVLGFGLYSLSRLRLDLYPDVAFPTVLVVTTYTGAGPEDMETLVSRPLEGAVAGVAGAQKVESESRPPDIPPCDLALMRRSPLALRSL